jgi:hypothetical protein
MKNILLLSILLIVSCKPTHKANFIISNAISQSTNSCPENGVCSIELIPNKSLEFKKDNIGMSYPVITEGNKTIFKYTYKRKSIPNTQDGNYTEIIYAELEETISDLDLSNLDLKNVKLYFGRLCYCKGQTGYYPIKNGDFKITSLDNDSVNFNLNFKISEVPQIITEINESISLKSN